MYFTYRDENRTLAEIGFWTNGGETLTRTDGTDRVRSLRVTHGVLQALGVQPLRGRWFTEAEHGPEAEGPDPIILSYAFAQSRFGGDAALGRDLLINSRPSQVVGIMPPDFRFLDMSPPFEVIVAMRIDPARAAIGGFGFDALARLKPGVTPAEASADLQRMVPIWLDAWPMVPGYSVTREAMQNWRITPVVRPLKDDMVGGIAERALGAHGRDRRGAAGRVRQHREPHARARRCAATGVRRTRRARRHAGTHRSRAARREPSCIGAVGGALGLALAYGGLELLVAIGPSNLPRLEEIAIHLPVLAFTVAVSLASTLAFGSITALKHARHVNVQAFAGARGSSAGRERTTTRNALVVVQVALALVLVVSAVLMIRTFQALRDVDPGFAEPATIQTVRTWVANQLIRDPAEFARVHEILDAIAAIPGVASAGFTSTLPMEGPPFVNTANVVIEGQTLAAGEAPPQRRMKLVSPGYFETMGSRIIAGRDLTWADIEAGGRVALISEDFARELGPEPAAALGKRIRTPVDSDDWREVIGVVQSLKDDALYLDAPSLVYWPAFMQNAFGGSGFATPALAFVVRSDRTGTATLNNEIREAVWSVNKDVPIALERTMQSLYAESLARTSFALVMLAIAGSMALALGRHRDLRRDRLRRRATAARDRDPDGARRAAPRGSSDVPSAGSCAQRRGSRDRPRGRARADALHVFAAVRNRADGCRDLRRGDRRHSRGRGARELPAGAARVGDRSRGDAEGRVAEDLRIERVRLRSAERQSHPRHTPFRADAILERDAAAVVLDDLARQHEPDARAMRLGREERHPEVVRASETGAVVLDLDQDRAALAAPTDAHPARLTGGFDGVTHQIDEHLLDLIGVDLEPHLAASLHGDATVV